MRKMEKGKEAKTIRGTKILSFSKDQFIFLKSAYTAKVSPYEKENFVGKRLLRPAAMAAWAVKCFVLLQVRDP